MPIRCRRESRSKRSHATLHVQTSRVRRRKLYLVRRCSRSAGAGAVWRWLSPAQRAQVYAKHYPAWAGLTPLDVDALWRDAGAP